MPPRRGWSPSSSELFNDAGALGSSPQERCFSELCRVLTLLGPPGHFGRADQRRPAVAGQRFTETQETPLGARAFRSAPRRLVKMLDSQYSVTRSDYWTWVVRFLSSAVSMLRAAIFCSVEPWWVEVVKFGVRKTSEQHLADGGAVCGEASPNRRDHSCRMRTVQLSHVDR